MKSRRVEETNAYDAALPLSLMALEFERCKDAYRAMEHRGVCQVTDMKITQFVFEDSNGKPSNEGVSRIKLWEGNYAMGPTKLKCLIYKIRAEKKAQIKDTEPPSKEQQQDNGPPSKNFYSEAGQGRVVLSWVDCTLKDYAEAECCGKDLSPLFRTCVIDIACGLEALLKANLYPTKITTHYLYVCKVCLARQGKLLVIESDGKELVNPRA